MKKRPNIFIIAGALLVFIGCAAIAAIDITAENRYNTAADTAKHIEQLLPDYSAGVEDMYSSDDMPVLSLDGTDYIALLNVNKYGINLPVQSLWDKKAVLDSPYCFAGSCYSGSMVIGGSSKQFEFLLKLDLADKITVTDMLGAQFSYTVDKIERSKTADADRIVDADYQLVLFTQDLQSGSYVIVKCKNTV